MARGRRISNDGASGAEAEMVRRIHSNPVVEPAIYGECRRNYAASIGRYIFDGCCEFLKSGEDGTPEALLCDACGCHRNFHRKELHSHHHASTFCLFRQPPTTPHLLPPPPPPPPLLHMIIHNAEAVPNHPLQSDVKSETLDTGEIEVEMTKNKGTRTRRKESEPSQAVADYRSSKLKEERIN